LIRHDPPEYTMSDPSRDLESLFLAALDIESSDERAAFVSRSCGGDLGLRRELEELLASHEVAGSFLEQPAQGLDRTMVSPGSDEARAVSLDAGLAISLDREAAVVLGDANHSVLKMLSNTLNEVPHVSLRESEAEGAGPISRPGSREIPHSDADGRYRLDGEIARGGMGAIIKGRDTDLGRDLAIKVLLDSHKDKPEVIQRFVEEAQIGGQLQHPGIAPIYELGQFADKRPYFAMKLVKGQTLSKLLADREDAGDDRGKFIGIFEQVCQTMAYAHSRGVIHRDLKPANIMVGAFGEVQVMDWGLAKVLQFGGVADERKSRMQQDQSIIQTLRSGVGSDAPVIGSVGSAGSETQMGSVMGTPAYMPPEQALGEIDQLDERTDVFGLGAILCEILTGDPPYVAEGGTQIFRLASRGKLDRCFQRLDECEADRDLVAVAKNCLGLKPSDRPRHAGEVSKFVTAHIESVEVKLRKSEIERAAQTARADAEAAQAEAERQRAEAESARAQEETRRRRMSLAFAASILFLVAVGSGGWLYLERQNTKRTAAEAEAQKKHAEEMETLAEQRDVQRTKAEQERAKAQQIAHGLILSLAFNALHEGDYERVEELLLSKQPDFSQGGYFEWRLLWEQVQRHRPDSAIEYKDPIKFLVPSSSGDMIAIGTETGRLLLHRDGKDDLEIDLPRVGTTLWAITADARFVADTALVVAGSLDDGRGILALVSVQNQSAVTLTVCSNSVTDLAVSADGKIVVAATKVGDIVAIDVESHEEIWNESHEPNLPKDRFVTIVDDAVACVSSNGTLVTLRRLSDGVLRGQPLSLDYRAQSLATSNDGKRLGISSTVGIDVFTIRRNGVLGFEKRVPIRSNGFSFSPDDSEIVSADSYGGIRFFDARTCQTVDRCVHRNGVSTVTALAYLKEGEALVSGDAFGTVMFWDLRHARPSKFETAKQRNAFQFVAVSPDTSMVATPAANGSGVTLWHRHSEELDFLAEGKPVNVRGLAFSHDSRLVAAAANGGVFVWRVIDGRLVRKVPTNRNNWSVAFSPDGEWLAVGGGGGVTLVDVQRNWTTEEMKGCAHTAAYISLDFSREGRFLVAGGGHWQFRSDDPQGEAIVWDMADDRPVKHHRETTKQMVYSVDFSPAQSSAELVAIGGLQPTVKLLDVRSRTAKEIKGQSWWITGIAFTHDGERLATSSPTGEITFWDMATLDEVGTFRPRGHTRRIAFTSDGLVAASSEGFVRFWQAASVEECRAVFSK
jgi:serine/threonine protein kinase/WD40 repeat protein